MPPPHTKKVVSEKDKVILKQWNTGAKYEAHWAYTPKATSQCRRVLMDSSGNDSPKKADYQRRQIATHLSVASIWDLHRPAAHACGSGCLVDDEAPMLMTNLWTHSWPPTNTASVGRGAGLTLRDMRTRMVLRKTVRAAFRRSIGW